MANIENIKKKYNLTGNTYSSEDADRALSDLFSVSRKLALLNRELSEKAAALEAEKTAIEENIAGITAERDELAAFKANEAIAVKSVKKEIEQLEDENNTLAGRIDTLTAAIDSLEKDKIEIATQRDEITALNAALTTEKDGLCAETAMLRKKIEELEADNIRLSGELTEANAAIQAEKEKAASEIERIENELRAEIVNAAKTAEEIPETVQMPDDFPQSIPAILPNELTEKAEDEIDNSEDEIYRKLAESLNDSSPVGNAESAPEQPADDTADAQKDPLEDELRRVLEIQNENASKENTEDVNTHSLFSSIFQNKKEADKSKPAEKIEEQKIDFDNQPEEKESENPYGFDADNSRSMNDMKSRLASIKNRNK